MTTFTLASASAKQVWSGEYQTEYTRESGYREYMGKTANSIIRVHSDLTKTNGDYLHVPYIGALKADGVTGSTMLRGNEENLSNFSCGVRVTQKRHGVTISNNEKYRTEIDLANAAREQLKAWSSSDLRKDVNKALGHVILAGANDGNGIPLEDSYKAYADATAAERNAYLAKNSDRLLFGSTVGGSVYATQLGTITGTQKLTLEFLNKARSLARQANTFRINPYRTDASAGREWYVAFVTSDGMAQAMEDERIYGANVNARQRGLDDNPIFQGGDLIVNGIIIREIPEIASLGAVGGSGANVNPMYMCGAQAVAVAYAQMTKQVTDSYDYGDKNGVGVTEIRGVNKFSVAGVQTGMVTAYHAA